MFFWLIGQGKSIFSKAVMPVIGVIVLATICSGGVIDLIVLSVGLTLLLFLLLELGGLPMLLMGGTWEAFYRDHAEYAADDFAAELGQAPKLIEYLEKYQLFDVSIPWNKGKTHPPIELRIDRLMKKAGITPPVPTLPAGVPPIDAPLELPPVAAQHVPTPIQRTEETRFCDQCGAQNRVKARHCWKCGEPLPPIPPPNGFNVTYQLRLAFVVDCSRISL